MSKYGIDVALWQRGIDFNKAKAEGVEFAIIKIGERGAEGNMYLDPCFEDHYNKAKAAGLSVGGFWWGGFRNEAEAKEEAAFVAKAIKGKQFDYPIFLDVEDNRMNVGKDATTRNVSAFCIAMENAGYWCGVYFNPDWYYYKIYGEQITTRFSWWCAYWINSKPSFPTLQMWQKSKKIIGGVECDYDYCYVDYPALIKAKGKNGYGDKPTPKPTPKPAELSKGDKITIKKNAPIYGTNDPFADFVYDTVYVVREINGDRVVFAPKKTGAITGAVDKKYCVRVE